MLNRISHTITSTLDLDQVAYAFIEEIHDSLGITTVAIWLHDEETGELLCMGAFGQQSQTGEQIIGQGIANCVSRNRQSLIIKDTRLDKRCSPPCLDKTSGLEIRSILAIPLISKQDVIGVIQVMDTEVNRFMESDLTLLESLGATAAVAIVNARLFCQVQHLSITDDLTGVYNRRHFFELAAREFSRAIRYKKPLSLIMFDIDHFKNINDTYGHAMGDRVLTEVTTRCRQRIRENDIIGRYGGEEFLLLLPETDMINAHKVAERLIHSISQIQLKTDGTILRVTISVGVASVDEDCATLNDLFLKADRTLYEAKRAGRDQIQIAINNR